MVFRGPIQVRYDAAGDVLYVSLGPDRPGAYEPYDGDPAISIRYADDTDEPIGLMVISFSKWAASEKPLPLEKLAVVSP